MGKYIKKNKLHLGKTNDEIKENLVDLLKYVYYQCPLDHDAMKKMYEHIDVPISFDDLDLRYGDYRWKLEFVDNDEPDDEYVYQVKDDLDLDWFDNKSMITEIHNFVKNSSTKKLKLEQFKTGRLANYRGINKDARGVRYMDWRLHRWEQIELSGKFGISFDDIIIAAHKIKSHKFENWYELFTGIKELDIDGEHICISVKMDHGS